MQVSGHTPSPPDDVPVLDWHRARSSFPDGFDMTRPTALLIEECSRWMRDLGEDLDKKSRDAVERALHSLKGNALIFGARPVADLTEDLEHRARAGDLDGVREQLPALTAEVARLVAALQKGPPRRV